LYAGRALYFVRVRTGGYSSKSPKQNEPGQNSIEETADSSSAVFISPY
jgi:hypothetical protein